MTLNLDELEAKFTAMRSALDENHDDYESVTMAATTKLVQEWEEVAEDNWLPLIAECRELREAAFHEATQSATWQALNFTLRKSLDSCKAENERYRKALENVRDNQFLWGVTASDLAREALGG